MILAFPDGTTVQATGLGRPEGDPEPDFGLYLDHRWSVPWPHEHIPWEDFGLPQDPAAARKSIANAFNRARSGDGVEVGCYGGIGRTGTVLACMAVISGVRGTDAVEWVRRNYRTQAVETEEQEQFVAEFVERLSEGGG